MALVASADAGIEHHPGRAYVWESDVQGKPATGHPILAPVSGEQRGGSVNFLNDGRLVTSGEDQWFKLWDVDRGRGETTFAVRASGFTRPTWITLPDGARAVIARSSGAGARDQLELVDTKNGRTTRAPLTVKGANFNVLAASGDGRRIVAAGELSGAEGTNVQIGHFWVWEVETGQIVTRFPALLAPIPRPEDKEGLAQLSSGQIVTMVVDQKASGSQQPTTGESFAHGTSPPENPCGRWRA